MKYAVWFVRLVYAAWMIPAGLNHFIRLYPQPIGNQPLSIEVFTALLDSGLFTLVKATELVAGRGGAARLPPAAVPADGAAGLVHGLVLGHRAAGLVDRLGDLRLVGAGLQRGAVPRLLAQLSRDVRQGRGRSWPAGSCRASHAGRRCAMTRALDALRVLLGAVMAVTALQYFLPSLLPFLPTATWEDPMSIRLMTAFDKSGLLAVAKFIHLAAGVLLLCNRAVPFALAALVTVNLCGTYISLFVEADPLLAVLAVLTMGSMGC